MRGILVSWASAMVVVNTRGQDGTIGAKFILLLLTSARKTSKHSRARADVCKILLTATE